MAKYHDKCILCSSSRLSDLQGYERHEMCKCTSCGFVFMKRIPTLEELGEHYKLYSYTNDSNVSPVTIKSFEALLDDFEPFRKNNLILDVGCGKGYFLNEARKRGWQVYGTEFSEQAVKICREKGITMYQGDLNPSEFGGLKFDVVYNSEVIEHVNNPTLQFAKMNELLRTGGLLYMTTPNFNCYLRHKYKADYNIIEYPEHLGYFTKATLNRGLENAGFKKRKLLTTGISISRAAFSKGSVEKVAEVLSKEENLRATMSSNILMKTVKKLVNTLLTLSGLGITLKAYYIKP
jgi:2-polyprenyl-3-methyl-5-hydroxy-6-metoxy-1,4-benzoquinol methylase